MPTDAEDLAARLRPILVEAARRQKTLTYRDLVQAAQVPPPHTIHKTTEALEAMVQADHAAGRPLLAAVAVGKSGLPGPGFFQLLAELGRYDGPKGGAAAEAHHRKELEAAWAYWGAAA